MTLKANFNHKWFSLLNACTYKKAKLSRLAEIARYVPTE